MVTAPELSLVVLIGPPGSGKSTFARKHFKPVDVLNSDCRRLPVADDEVGTPTQMGVFTASSIRQRQK